MKVVTICTDSTRSGFAGLRRWTAILSYNGKKREISGSTRKTVNVQIEMTALIAALRVLKEPCNVIICSDSTTYLKQGITAWLPKWKQNGWKYSDGRSSLIKNQELWAALDQEAQRHQVQWVWVSRRGWIPKNERCEKLVRRAIANYATN